MSSVRLLTALKAQLAGDSDGAARIFSTIPQTKENAIETAYIQALNYDGSLIVIRDNGASHTVTPVSDEAFQPGTYAYVSINNDVQIAHGTVK